MDDCVSLMLKSLKQHRIAAIAQKNIVGPWLLAAQAKQPELGFPEEDLTAVQCSSWVMILFCEGKKRRRTCMHYSCKKCLINNELHPLRPQRDERIENSLSLRFSWKFRHPLTTSFAAPARTQTWHIRVQLHQGLKHIRMKRTVIDSNSEYDMVWQHEDNKWWLTARLQRPLSGHELNQNPVAMHRTVHLWCRSLFTYTSDDIFWGLRYVGSPTLRGSPNVS